MKSERPEEKVVRITAARRLTIALSESCTGGLVGFRITSVPGSSDVFRGAVVNVDVVDGNGHRHRERHAESQVSGCRDASTCASSERVDTSDEQREEGEKHRLRE